MRPIMTNIYIDAGAATGDTHACIWRMAQSAGLMNPAAGLSGLSSHDIDVGQPLPSVKGYLPAAMEGMRHLHPRPSGCCQHLQCRARSKCPRNRHAFATSHGAELQWANA